MDLNINPEIQKIKIGGVIYEHCRSLPPIIINQDNKEEYQNYFESINNIANVSGSDLMLLFAEICTLVDGKIKESIQEEFLNPIAIVAYAVKQSSDIISQLKENKGEFVLEGYSYCFIVIFLSELFSYYAGFLNHLKMIKYTTSGMIVKAGSVANDMPVSRMQSTLAFILSQEFESLREKFKVIECYKLAYNRRTLH
jgi:hypothetical protein